MYLPMSSQPDDEEAQENLDVGHYLYKEILNQALYAAPIGDEPKMVCVAIHKIAWAAKF